MLARYCGAFGVSCAAHAALLVWLAWPFGTSAAARDVTIVLLPPAEDSAYHGLKPVDRLDSGWKTPGLSEGLALAGADVDRIAVQLPVLFPFVTPGLAIESFFPVEASPARLVFENPYRRPTVSPDMEPLPPLDRSAAELQAIVDKAWSRGRRWQSFAIVRALTAAYDADDERLATVVRLYREQDALQPYADGAVRDLRLWAQLGLAADHATFIGFIRDYVSLHPGTKCGTEMLLLLDTIAQANEDALAVLAETNQPGDLAWTKMAHPRAFELARQIQRQYARTLERMRLTSRIGIEDYYERQRLAILAGIAQTSPKGYRADEARYLIGAILWKQFRRQEAVRVWREMSSAPAGAHAAAIEQIRIAVLTPRPDERNIGFILANDEGRWRSFSGERLRRFGYRVNTF